MTKSVDYSLYLVTDRPLLCGKDLLMTVELAIQGGATVIQLREKHVGTLEFYQIAMKLKAVTDKYRVPLIINDRLDIALAVDADGLHIGQQDLPLTVARRLFGAHKIIGVSVANIAQALEAQEQGADYVGAGAIFPTATKDDADKVSLEELCRMKQMVTIPVIAIGGIQDANVGEVMATGVDGAAVVSAIIASSNPLKATQKLSQLIHHSRTK